ncbi:MAG TPA: hypothetical protein VE504_05220 [Nitrososphaeraceae archaeon]|jgi:hypothetical protein|nr:hypothetical protein [Nitrososphaeraceae archaeon]
MTKASEERREKKRDEIQTSEIIDEEEKVIEELENQGELKKEVPLGGEEFEEEEPRQGD